MKDIIWLAFQHPWRSVLLGWALTMASGEREGRDG